MDVLAEGWRFLPHSYAIAHQFQCLELLKRSSIRLWHRDVPYYAPHWQRIHGLLPPEAEAQLLAIPDPPPGQAMDLTLRMGYPLDFSRAESSQLGVFGTAELGLVKRVAVAGSLPLAEAQAQSGAVIFTSSHWSRDGFLRSGADPQRTLVVPLGFNPNIFKPIAPEERQSLRQALGWEGFVFLNIGGMGGNKGIPLLLQAFAVITEYYPEARLVLKGLDALYPSEQLIAEILQSFDEATIQRVRDRLIYLGGNLSFQQTAALYQAADNYVSPYLAEGFNLPVLEAIACGLPIICTAGGSTDDFTKAEFALKIASDRQETEIEAGQMGYYLLPDLDHLLALMEQVIRDREFSAIARQVGAAFVRQHFTWEHTVDKLLRSFSPPPSTQPGNPSPAPTDSEA